MIQLTPIKLCQYGSIPQQMFLLRERYTIIYSLELMPMNPYQIIKKSKLYKVNNISIYEYSEFFFILFRMAGIQINTIKATM